MRSTFITLVLLILVINAQAQITKDLLYKQRFVESTNMHVDQNGKIVESPVGALGIAQFMPETWGWMKSAKLIPEYFDIHNKEHQIKAQEILMVYLYKIDYGISDNRVALAAASYHAGVNRIKRIVKDHQEEWRFHIPDSTKEYLHKLNL